MARTNNAKVTVPTFVDLGALNPRYRQACRALLAPQGVTVQRLATVLHLDERPARLMIDRLRRKGVPINNVGPCRFKVVRGGKKF